MLVLVNVKKHQHNLLELTENYFSFPELSGLPLTLAIMIYVSYDYYDK